MAEGRSILRTTLPHEKAGKVDKDHLRILLRVVKCQTANPLGFSSKLHEVAAVNVGDRICEAEIIRCDALGRVRGHPHRKLSKYSDKRKRRDAGRGRNARFSSCRRVVDRSGPREPGITKARNVGELGSKTVCVRLVRDLNQLYRDLAALHELDCDPSGFEWIEADDGEHSVYAWLRRGADSRSCVVVVCNFTPVPRQQYRLGFVQDILAGSPPPRTSFKASLAKTWIPSQASLRGVL